MIHEIKEGDVIMVTTTPDMRDEWVMIASCNHSFISNTHGEELSSYYAYDCNSEFKSFCDGTLQAYSIHRPPSNWREVMFKDAPDDLAKCKKQYPHLFKKMFTR